MSDDTHDIHYQKTWGTPLGQDCIDFDTSLARWLGDRLEFLSKHTNTHPTNYDTLEHWHKDLSHHGNTLQKYAQNSTEIKNAREAMRWVAEHFGAFWD